MINARSLSGHPASLMIWLPFLIGLQGIPHTGALRTLFLLVGVVHLFWLRSTVPTPLPQFHGGVVRSTFWLLTAWLVLQSALIAPEPLPALQALTGDWAKLILMAALGLWLARVVPDRRWIAVALFSGAFLHVLATLGLQLVSLASGGGLVYNRSSIADYALTSPFTTTALAWLLADGTARLWHGRSLFPWPAIVSAILALMALAAEALLMAKSGQVMTAILVAAVSLALLTNPRLRRRWSISLTAAGVVAVALVVVVGESRWSSIDGSFRAAWHQPVPLQVVVTDDVPLPANLNHSLYIRAVRARVALEGVAEHPWGLGFGPEVFGRYVTERYDIPKGISSSNSGLIDFALANGVIGLCLLLFVTGSLIWRGWRTFLAGRPEGAALALLVLHHIGRYTLDGTLGGSRFTGMALAIGALWALSVMEKRGSPADSQ